MIELLPDPSHLGAVTAGGCGSGAGLRREAGHRPLAVGGNSATPLADPELIVDYGRLPGLGLGGVKRVSVSSGVFKLTHYPLPSGEG